MSLLLFFTLFVVSTASGEDLPGANVTQPQLNVSTSSPIEELVTSTCSEGESIGCLKAAMAGLVPALAVPRRVVVWPGLAVIAGGFSVDPPPETGAKVDGYLARGLRAFLASLSLQVRVLDSEMGRRLAKFSRMFTDTEDENDNTGRKKKVNNALMLGALFSGGTLLALGMAAISAMAGKAMMLSVLSLGMSLMNGRAGNGNGGGGGGGGHEKTTYEIIHTVPSHHEDYGHRQWADVTHEGYHVVKAH